MPAERFFHDSSFKQGEIIHLEDFEFHHLCNVMRLKLGEKVEIVNGRGSLAQAEIENLKKKSAALLIHQVTEVAPPDFKLILAQGIPRGNRLDFILEKGTELGMTEIWLFPAKLSERKEISASQMHRCHALLIAAMKQCGRLHLPKVMIKDPVTEWQAPPFPCFYGDVGTQAPRFSECLQKQKLAKGLIFCVGPEGGFTIQEEEALKSIGSQGVTLNGNILRTDTAAIAALAIAAAIC